MRPPTEHVDVRVERTREAVLACARDLLTSEGPAAVTPQRIAKATGISRSTIHRHWPEPRRILIDAVDDFVDETEVPLLGDLRLDLAVDLHHLRVKLEDPAEVAVMMSMLSYACFEADFADVVHEQVAHHLARLGRVLAKAREDGVLQGEIDPEHAAAVLAGPIFFRRMFLGLDVTADLVDEVIESFVRSHASPAPRRDEGTP
jgi:AcrR family transcriptional regulator